MLKVHGLVRLTAEPELKVIGENKVANFRVATNGRAKDDPSTFWNCEAWGAKGEVITRYVTKGQLIYIEGVMKQRTYDGKDGQKHTVDEVNVYDFEFTGKAADK